MYKIQLGVLYNTATKLSLLESRNVILQTPMWLWISIETSRHLKVGYLPEVRLAEHTKNGKVNISKLAEHVWNEQYKIL